MRSLPEITAPAVLLSGSVAGHEKAGALRPAKILQLALLLLVVANLGRIPVFSTGGRDAPILANDIFVAAVLLTGMLGMAVARRARLDSVALSGLAFAAIGGISTLVAVSKFGLSGFEVAVSLAYLARWVFYFALYVVAINVLRTDDVVPVWRALETAVLAFAAFGIVQAATLPNFAQIIYPESRAYVDWDPQYHRLVSTLLDPNFAGALILSVLLVQIAQLTGGLRIAAWKPLLLTVALVLTQSRSSILALLVAGMMIIAIRGVGKRVLRFGIAALLVLAILAPKLLEYARAYNKLEIDASALSRLVMWARGISVFSDHPFIGVGMNTWGFVQERYGWERLGVASYGIEGGLLFVAVMTGLIGLTAFVTMFVLAVRRCMRIWRSTAVSPEFRAIAIGTAAFSVALLIHSMFTNSLFLPFILEPLFVLWALTRVIAISEPAGA